MQMALNSALSAFAAIPSAHTFRPTFIASVEYVLGVSEMSAVINCLVTPYGDENRKIKATSFRLNAADNYDYSSRRVLLKGVENESCIINYTDHNRSTHNSVVTYCGC